MNLSEIAKHFGVSPASVSIVRKGLPGVSSKTRRQIQQCLEENGYAYQPYVLSAGTQPSHCDDQQFIRLVKYKKSALLVDKNEGFVESIIDAVDAHARLSGYTLLLNTVSFAEYASYLSELKQKACAGLLVVATEMERREILKLAQLPFPLVILDSEHPALPFCTVTMNNRDIAYMATGRLFALGHARVGYLRSSIATGNFLSRSNGYLEALREHGQPWDDALVYELRPSTEGAYHDMLACLATRPLPSALFADNDLIAIGAMRAIQKTGLHVPGDVSIIGVDNTPLSQVCTPPLSTMQISRPALGKQAFAALLSQIENPAQEPVHYRVGSRLIERGSVGPGPSANGVARAANARLYASPGRL